MSEPATISFLDLWAQREEARAERDVLQVEVERLREGWDVDVDWANKLLLERDSARARVEELEQALREAVGARDHASSDAYRRGYEAGKKLRTEVKRLQGQG